MSRTNQTRRLLLVALLITASLSSGHTSEKSTVFNTLPDEGTAVRFYYQSAGNYLHPPFIFRVVGEEDPRLNTAPMTRQGRTVYIAAAEMQDVLQGLAHLHLSWKKSKEIEILGPPGVADLTDNMVVTIVSAQGTLRGKIVPAKICQNLAPLDSAVKTPRALWEFEEFRYEYDCIVPGLNRSLYPNHY